MNQNNKMSRVITALLCGILFYSASVHSSNLTISQTPLLLGGVVEPNVVFTLDDSGSMRREVMPEGIVFFDQLFPVIPGLYGPGDFPNIVPAFTNSDTGAFLRSSFNNTVFYNPAITYRPWSNPDGSVFADAPVNCAPHNPVAADLGCRDFTQLNTELATWVTDTAILPDTELDFWPATYFIYRASEVPPPPVGLASSYDRVEIRSGGSYTGGAGRTDCVSAPICTYEEEIQNFANWYSYYRSRVLLSRASIGRAFAEQGPDLRVGFATINSGSAIIDGVHSDGTLVAGVRKFDGADRTVFFDRLYGAPIPIAATPLRRSMDDVGVYYERTDNAGPWGQTPGTGDATPQLACRRSYNVLMTDSFGDGDDARTEGARANVDGGSGPTITSTDGSRTFNYSPVLPFRDAFANTLADVAMYYWYRDLRPDLPNRVPVSANDPAFWQHMVNFTVSLGVDGTLNSTTDLQALTDGTKSWPDPASSQLAKTDDLWHAAVNSRGSFLNAINADSLTTAFSSILSAIADITGSASSPALNSGSIGGNTHLYQARYDSSDWSGQLLAFPIGSNGALGAPVWDTGAVLSSQNPDSGREILTFDPVARAGRAFRAGALNASQVNALNINPLNFTDDGRAADRLQYLRGDQTEEASAGGSFRNRNSLLGDVVHSSPAFVGRPNSVYPDVWDDLTIQGDTPPENNVPYSQFQIAGRERQQIVYFGANDGLLHGVDAGVFNPVSGSFTAGTGEEVLGYVPATLIDRLNLLTDPAYDHRFYVDATPSISEAFFANSWHSVLAGGLGAGGQGIFALDVTDPSAFDESNAASLVLWEFSDQDDADLGNTFGQPVNIVRLHNQKWAAVFGNGYNNTDPDGHASATGNAVLFIVDLETGTLIRKIDTNQGMLQDPQGLNRPNGLSTPAPVDRDGDSIVDVVYAGDLFGNLWKFNLSAADENQWGVDFGGQPMFVARSANGGVQPIMVRPQVGRSPVLAGSLEFDANSNQLIADQASGEYIHDAANGVPIHGSLIYFGTGKFFEVGDTIPVGQVTQTFYALWDKQLPVADADFSVPPFNRNQLLAQEIFQEFNAGDPNNPFGFDLRVTTDHAIRWHACGGVPPAICDPQLDQDGNILGDYLGWRMDLVNTENGNTYNAGERVVSEPVLRDGRIIFTTLVPDTDPCNSGSSGWLMEVDAESGSRLNFSAFDLNGDQLFSVADFVFVSVDATSSQAVPVSGKKSSVGVISTPAILNSSDQKLEYKYTSGSSGHVETTVENPGGRVGRQSWQQLFEN